MASNFETTSLSPRDQERVQAIKDHVRATTGAELKTPDAIRAAFTAWELANIPRFIPGVPSMDQDPEANERWQRREIDKQQNPLEHES